MRAKKFGNEVSEDKKLARLIKFGAVTDQVCKISLLLIKKMLINAYLCIKIVRYLLNVLHI
jgi:hypothetical protein